MATFSVQQIVEYFVAHREIVACRVGTGEIRQIDAVWRFPNPLTIPFRAGEESPRYREPKNSREVPAQAGAVFNLLPSHSIGGRWVKDGRARRGSERRSAEHTSELQSQSNLTCRL